MRSIEYRIAMPPTAIAALSTPTAPATMAIHFSTVFADHRPLFFVHNSMNFIPRAAVLADFLHLRDLLVAKIQLFLKLSLLV